MAFYWGDKLVRCVQTLLIMQKGKKLSPCSDHRDFSLCLWSTDLDTDDNKKAEPTSAGVSQAFWLV